MSPTLIFLKRSAVVAACAGLLPALAAITAASAAEDAAWEKLLRLQLEDGHKCTLSGVVYVREMPSGDSIIYSGRAKCFDGREFDFSQDKPHMKFVIKACEPTVC